MPVSDLTEQQAAQAIKITGSDLTGVETNYVNADSSGNLYVKPASNGPVTPGTAASYSSLMGGQYNTSLPILTNGQQAAIQLDSTGRLQIAPLPTGANVIGAVTQSGNWNVRLQDGAGIAITSTLVSSKQGLDVNVISGTITSTAGATDKAGFTYGTTVQQVIGGVYQDTSPTLTAGQQGAVRLTAYRGFHVNLRDSSGNEITTLPISAASLPLPTGAATAANQATANTSLASIDSKIPSNLTVTSTRLLVDGSGVTQPVSGTVTSNQGTANTIANAWPHKITDGTNTAGVTANMDLEVCDKMDDGGVHGTVSVTTTAVELKVSGSVLTNRKYIIIQARANNVYIGFSNTVTTATGVQVFKNQTLMFPLGPGTHLWAISDQAGGVDTRVSEIA